MSAAESRAAAQVTRHCARSGCERPAPRDGLVCGHCARDGLALVQSLPKRWADLRVALQPGQRGAGERIARPKPASRPPLSSSTLDVVEAVEAHAERVDDLVRAVVGMPARATYRTLRRVVVLGAAAELARQHWPRVMATTAAPRLLDDGARLARRVDVALGLDDVVHRLHAPCPACGLLTLLRRNGDDHVRCAACGSSWDERAYRHLVRVLAAELGP